MNCRMRLVSIGILGTLAAGSPSCRKADETGPGQTSAATGVSIYRNHCASCHGENGEGVADEYDEPLWGDKSLESLARYIHRRMPEDAEDLVIDDDAALVAGYIFEAFYSPEAQARIRPPRIEMTRLTNNQFRQSIADLIASFYPVPAVTTTGGLRGHYYNSKKMNKTEKHVLERVDPVISFDYGNESPAEGVTQQAFSITWSGGLLVNESGEYRFRIRTRNGALLHLNSPASGEAATGTWSEGAFIDAYVSSGNTEREETGRMFLLGGRAYPISLQYFSYQEGLASIHLEWKPPHGTWEPIPPAHLSPDRAAPLVIVSTPFPPDDRSLGYERGSSVSGQWNESVSRAAIEVANLILQHLDQLAGSGARDNARALRDFCAAFAERAFRRPLTPEQREALVDHHFEESSPENAVKKTLLLTMTSPRFLYPGLADNEGMADGHTVAARLALILWDSLPDDILRTAAAQDRLRTPEQVTEQAQRMLKDPRARQKVREFFRHWLAMDEREDLAKDPNLFPGFDETLISDLRRSLEHFIEEIVWSRSSDYRELLSADYLYVSLRLAEFYGAPLPRDPGFQRSTLPDGTRAGVLTHPYLLAANAYHDNSSPIHRGVFLSRNVLGRLLKPPPEAVAFDNDMFDPDLTMREKVTELTKKESCMQCHAVINPIGFSLEHYDAVGRFRTEDNRRPVNTVSDYVTDDERQVRLTDARDLAQLAIGSGAAHRAFVTHLFHHLVKQAPEAYGRETLSMLGGEFAESRYSIRELIVDIALRTVTFREHDEPSKAGIPPSRRAPPANPR